jgi:hypothetical protein
MLLTTFFVEISGEKKQMNVKKRSGGGHSKETETQELGITE